MPASFLLGAGHCAASALDRVADHRPPLLLGGTVQVLLQRPTAAVPHGLVRLDGASQLRRRGPGKVGPTRPDERFVGRIARSRLRYAEAMGVEPESAGGADAPGIGRIAPLDRVDRTPILSVSA